MSDETLPIVGLPLAIDSMQKNGVLPFVVGLAQGESFETAFTHVSSSEAQRDPVSFVIGEWFKWKLYKGVKSNSVINILGLELGL